MEGYTGAKGADNLTGLLCLRNHYYAPNTGRFTQEDPIGFAGGINLYAYAGGNPATFTDPFGLCPPKDDNFSDCEPGSSGWYAYRLATGQGSAALNTIGGVLASCGESFWCNRVLDVASLGAGALERRGAMGGTEAAVRVIGHHPAYLQVAEAIGGKAFNVPTEIWEGMSEGERWAANVKFVDRGIQAGAEFVLATARTEIRAGAASEREIQYLLQHGYEWSKTGMSLIPR